MQFQFPNEPSDTMPILHIFCAISEERVRLWVCYFVLFHHGGSQRWKIMWLNTLFTNSITHYLHGNRKQQHTHADSVVIKKKCLPRCNQKTNLDKTLFSTMKLEVIIMVSQGSQKKCSTAKQYLVSYIHNC